MNPKDKSGAKATRRESIESLNLDDEPPHTYSMYRIAPVITPPAVQKPKPVLTVDTKHKVMQPILGASQATPKLPNWENDADIIEVVDAMEMINRVESITSSKQ